MSNSLSAVHPELVAEWSDRNLPLTPDSITFGSNKKVWWKGACGHEWETSVKARSNGEKCPICSGARVIEGINDLSTLKPELASEWSEKNEIKPTDVSIGSHKKVIWKCKLGHEWIATVKSRTINKTGCPYCSHMRVAPIGLYFEGKRYSVSEIDKIGAETAALTHGHELGYIPAAALVHILHILSHNEDVKMLDAVLDMKKAIRREFVNVKHLSEQIALIDKAIDLANEDVDDLEAIRELGQGWVAEETLAIAIYCALKYSNDFDKALIASVNHSGDSDSTGAVTGNILGAYLGLSGIPEKYLKNLELKNVILELADDLFNDCKITEYGSYHDEIWEQKYIYKSYRPKR